MPSRADEMIGIHKMLVQAILENPGDFKWSLQGFGMLRAYIRPEVRLHIWDSRFRVENVSLMHTHPWHFQSLVVAGRVRQVRYEEASAGPPMDRDFNVLPVYNRQTILCGTGDGLVDDGQAKVRLRARDEEVYEEGQTYEQKAHEIHVSMPEDGTITIVERNFLDDADHAFVYWPDGQEWVTAEPREAGKSAVKQICRRALTTWFA